MVEISDTNTRKNFQRSSQERTSKITASLKETGAVSPAHPCAGSCLTCTSFLCTHSQTVSAVLPAIDTRDCSALYGLGMGNPSTLAKLWTYKPDDKILGDVPSWNPNAARP